MLTFSERESHQGEPEISEMTPLGAARTARHSRGCRAVLEFRSNTLLNTDSPDSKALDYAQFLHLAVFGKSTPNHQQSCQAENHQDRWQRMMHIKDASNYKLNLQTQFTNSTQKL
ncbi:unnamed protein product, partial [Nesidiocoris tenuis]